MLEKELNKIYDFQKAKVCLPHSHQYTVFLIDIAQYSYLFGNNALPFYILHILYHNFLDFGTRSAN